MNENKLVGEAYFFNFSPNYHAFDGDYDLVLASSDCAIKLKRQ